MKTIELQMTRLLILASVMFFSSNADAYGSLRCKGKIVDVGMRMEKVFKLCGEPEKRIVERVPVRSRVSTGFSRFSGVSFSEKWEYDRGWGRFPVMLIFQDETLKRVAYAQKRSSAH